jgi:pimeloyl-ACP methyl ester carboxylesterase
MASGAAPAVTQAPTKVQRYLEAERLLWDHYGLTPVDRSVDLASGHLRVQEVGSGEPVVFIHGTGGSGAYFAPLLRELQGFRCMVIDRPGWGLSASLDYSRRPYATIAADLLRDTLDALGVERAHVVGASIGNLWALRFAMAHPSRISRVVLLGGGPIAAEVTVPRFIRLLRSPIGQIIIRLPENPGMLRKQLVGLGHAASVAAGRIPEAFVDWHMASSRYTDWLTHERDMVRAIVDRQGFVRGLVPDADREIVRIQQPTLMVFGTADPGGSVDIWRRFIDRFPGGELELVEAGGHLVWYDDPEGVGERVRGFLAG